MKIKTKVKNNVVNTIDKYKIKRARQAEINKFKDKRRVSIYSEVSLSQEQKQAIDKLYIENYGEKIPYTWHRHFTAFTGKFDKYYFPELLYIPEFEKYMNENESYVNVLQDKNILNLIAKSLEVKIPETIFTCINGLIQDNEHKIVSLNAAVKKLEGNEYFIKPTVDTCSGVGCQVINVNNGYDTITKKSLTDIIKSKGKNWIIQDRLKCHSSISNIYPDSVNTFRIMTYIWDNEICHAPSILRIGQGGAHLDNAHAGGMFIALDDNGTLHSKAFTEFKKEYLEHPDTHFKFDSYKIDLFPKVLETAKKCHLCIPQIGCINWDFTIDQNGTPVLIEMNLRYGSIWLFQMTHGCGVFGNKTPEILRWIKFMNKTRKSERQFLR